MITKNKFEKLLNKIITDIDENILNNFKNFCIFNNYPERYYNNLLKNFKIVANNYNFSNNILNKKYILKGQDTSELYTKYYYINLQNLGIIGVIQEKCKPKLVFAFKGLNFIYKNSHLSTEYNYEFLFVEPKYVKNLINSNKIIFIED